MSDYLFDPARVFSIPVREVRLGPCRLVNWRDR